MDGCMSVCLLGRKSGEMGCKEEGALPCSRFVNWYKRVEVDDVENFRDRHFQENYKKSGNGKM